jgi:hypothetical protein
MEWQRDRLARPEFRYWARSPESPARCTHIKEWEGGRGGESGARVGVNYKEEKEKE